jgi:CRISPR/Cas system-associated exonuclease Cas4 (RecB family)
MATSYSVSKLNEFEICRRKYKFSYIEKAAVEKPVSVEAFLGDAVHKTLENLYRLKMNGRLQTLDEALSYYAAIWEGPDRKHIKVTRENLGIDDYIGVGREALRKFYEANVPFDDGSTLALEKKFSFSIDPRGRFILSGKIDRISRRSDGAVVIIDYKTGAGFPSQQSVDGSMQMGLYQLAVKNLWPEFKQIELRQIFLRHGVVLNASMDNDMLEEIRYQAFQRILEIERATKDDNFPTKEGVLCDWCVYYELCPAKRHRLALESEADMEFDAETGRNLAAKYLDLDRKIKIMESERKAIREDIIRYCEAVEVDRLQAPNGSLKVKKSISKEFPGKSIDQDAYREISFLVRQAGIEECFTLDEKILYKEFFARERLPQELNDKLQKYLRPKSEYRLMPQFKEDDADET